MDMMSTSESKGRRLHRCYSLNDALESKYFSVRPQKAILNIDRLFHGEFVPEAPLEFTHRKGRMQGDFMGASYVSVFLVSNRVIDLFQEHQFEGWSTYSVLISDSQGAKVDGYSGFSVTGRTGPRFEQRDWYAALDSGRIVADYEPHKSLFFDPATWDGSDIFSPFGSRLTLVTEPVAKVLKKKRLTNMELELAAVFSLPEE
jgi:hypothetical protein